MGEQSALAAARLAAQAHAPGLARGFGGQGEVQQFLAQGLAPHEAALAVLHELVQVGPLALLPGGRRLLLVAPGLLLQVLPQALQHHLAQGFQARYLLASGIPAHGVFLAAAQGLHHAPDPSLEQVQAVGRFRRARGGVVAVAVEGGGLGGHLVIGQGLAQIEAAAHHLLPAGQHPVLNLQGGDALAGHIGNEAGLVDGCPHALGRRHPAVAVAHEHHQEGPAALDLGQADLEHQELLALLVGHGLGLHPPAQVDGLQVVEALAQAILDNGKDLVPQVDALDLHVAEGAGYENRPGAPVGSFIHGYAFPGLKAHGGALDLTGTAGLLRIVDTLGRLVGASQGLNCKVTL